MTPEEKLIILQYLVRSGIWIDNLAMVEGMYVAFIRTIIEHHDMMRGFGSVAFWEAVQKIDKPPPFPLLKYQLVDVDEETEDEENDSNS